MASWRVLELSEQPDREQIPQLLVKPIFNKDSYTVYLTDLGDIWSEELSLQGLIDRASSQQSPIEVSKQDTTQLAILLKTVEGSLCKTDDATCNITRNEGEALRLHTTVRLPEPLDSLTWTFNLEKRDALMLKDELVLPLLVASYTQHERISSLISILHEKDRAITRFMDQYESGNLDLTAAFPSVAQPGRKIVKREQAAKHVPALQPFREETWKQGLGGFNETQLSSLGLLEDSLAQSTWRVPPQLRSQPRERPWWSGISNKLVRPSKPPKRRAPKNEVKLNPPDQSDDETETEDEFEIHENFKSRNPKEGTPKERVSPNISTPMDMEQHDGADSTEDEDLDAPPKQHTHIEKQSPPSARQGTPQRDITQDQKAKPKAAGFRIGGKKKAASLSDQPISSQGDTGSGEDMRANNEDLRGDRMDIEPKPAPKGRRPFTIGGKSKKPNNKGDEDKVSTPDHTMPQRNEPASKPSPSPKREAKQEVAADEPVEDETPEQKAERRREELKRKSEDAAKKQAQQKKKKRF